MQGKRPSVHTIFDTEAHPAEACLYGDAMRLVSRRLANDLRILSLIGPDGEVVLDQVAWRNIFSAMNLPTVHQGG